MGKPFNLPMPHLLIKISNKFITSSKSHIMALQVDFCVSTGEIKVMHICLRSVGFSGPLLFMGNDIPLNCMCCINW